jgi:dTDP-4-dehydrorhamnose reductase
MTVLVLGFSGQLATHLRELLPNADFWGREKLDLTHTANARAAIEAHRPSVIVNAAAYTAVDKAESERDVAWTLNAEAPAMLARVAASLDVPLIHISSDYVFDGTKPAPYVESDPVNPISRYGRTKLEGERATLTASPHSLVVRTAWLFGSAGENFVTTMLALGEERGEVRVVDDQVGCPTFTGHLAEALVALAEGHEHGFLHVAGAGACSWFEFARAIFERAGMDVEARPCTTEEFPRPAPRPANSALVSERGAPVLPGWQDGLDAYLRVRA